MRLGVCVAFRAHAPAIVVASSSSAALSPEQALLAEKKAALATKKAAKKALERPSGEHPGGEGSDGEGGAEEEAEEGWTAEAQAALEEALRTFPASLPTDERWSSISEHVGRSVRDCVQRIKDVKAAIQTKQEGRIGDGAAKEGAPAPATESGAGASAGGEGAIAEADVDSLPDVSYFSLLDAASSRT